MMDFRIDPQGTMKFATHLHKIGTLKTMPAAWTDCSSARVRRSEGQLTVGTETTDLAEMPGLPTSYGGRYATGHSKTDPTAGLPDVKPASEAQAAAHRGQGDASLQDPESADNRDGRRQFLRRTIRSFCSSRTVRLRQVHDVESRRRLHGPGEWINPYQRTAGQKAWCSIV